MGQPQAPGGAAFATIAAYIAAPGEPDVGAIRSALREDGGIVLLPIPRPGRMLEWAEDDGNYRPYDRLPIEVPCGPVVGTGALGLIDHGVSVVLVPALAVDMGGARLGQGGGFYDRVIAELNEHSAGAVRVVAVVHDDEVLPAQTIPREAHDQLVQGALTPSRWWDFSHQT
jgi:5-formyltetrahydrofolate cyclo-ligase